MRCSADPRRPHRVRARPENRPHVLRYRNRQRAGLRHPQGLRLRRRRRARRSADTQRPDSAGAGLDVQTDEAVHRNQASGALRVAHREQGAGGAAPLRHRPTCVRRPFARSDHVLRGHRCLANQTSRADAADSSSRRLVALPRGRCRDHRRSHGSRTVDQKPARAPVDRRPRGGVGTRDVRMDRRRQGRRRPVP